MFSRLNELPAPNRDDVKGTHVPEAALFIPN
jgi:hypothetical protein